MPNRGAILQNQQTPPPPRETPFGKAQGTSVCPSGLPLPPEKDGLNYSTPSIGIDQKLTRGDPKILAPTRALHQTCVEEIPLPRLLFDSKSDCVTFGRNG